MCTVNIVRGERRVSKGSDHAVPVYTHRQDHELIGRACAAIRQRRLRESRVLTSAGTWE